MIKALDDLLHLFGESYTGDLEQDERRLSRRVYKSTGCGAWATVSEGGVTFGSIVEGADVDASSEYLAYPFTVASLEEAIQRIEEEVDEIWCVWNEEEVDEIWCVWNE